jgi:hypothetical protein
VKFTIGEITADSGARSGWILAALSDWLSLPQSKADETERPQAHGLFDPGTDWRTGAGFTATLSYRGETPGEVEQAVRELKAMASTDDLVRCVVETDLGTTWREVSIRKIDIPGLTFMGFMKGIAIDLLAPDPLAYGVESSVSTGLPAPGGGVRFVNGLSSAWTGTSGASTSTLSKDGTLLATNYCSDPKAVTLKTVWHSGGVQNVDGSYSYTAPTDYSSGTVYVAPLSDKLAVGTDYVVAITFDDIGSQSLIPNQSGYSIVSRTPTSLVYKVTARTDSTIDVAVWIQKGTTLTLRSAMVLTINDWNALQSLGIDWFAGDTYQGSGFRFPVDFGADGVDGRARFTNEGTAPASVRFRVSGGLPDGFSLRCVETGDVLSFRRPVASDDYVLLDSSDGSVLLNGVSPVSGYLTDDDWWQVGPGETCTVQFTSLGGVQGSPLLVLSGSPAYF